MIHKYPAYHKNKDIIGVNSQEVFIKAPDKQLLLEVKIYVTFPFSKIIFKKEWALIAILAAESKIDWGFAIIEDYETCLNGHEITNLNIDNMENYIPLIKENNTIIIKHLNDDNYIYFRQGLTYPETINKDLTKKYYEMEFERWKTLEAK